MDVQKKWVVENGEGHWEITVGDTTVSCDPNELYDTIAEITGGIAA